MSELIIESFAKVNLVLDVLYKRNDGYHEINSVMQEIDLRDRLSFKEIEKGIIIDSNNPQLPRDDRNLVYKVWDSLRKLTGVNKGIYINIDKKIPMAAGLAGGSSNAAASLKALNELWKLKLSDSELMDIGASLGADIPFCLMGGTAQARGIGEKLTRLKAFSQKHILICNPGIKISTPHVYSSLDLNKERLDVDGLIRSIEDQDLEAVSRKLANKMEKVVIKEYPIIEEIKATMIKNGALGSLMSGSGSTVFGLYDDEEKMDYSHKILSKTMDMVLMTKTI